jgi:hypothetical protein
MELSAKGRSSEAADPFMQRGTRQMRSLDLRRYALNGCVAAALLAGCGGSQPSTGTDAIPQWRATHAGVQACPKPDLNEAQCLVQIADEGVRLAPGVVNGWAPSDLQARYKLPISRGSNQIVAIVSVYDQPDGASDLSTYRTQFGLGPANFFKYNQAGYQGNYPVSCLKYYSRFGAFWCLSEDVGIEMASASCPKCTIYLVEANSIAPSDIEATAAEAVKLGAHIISNNWSCFRNPCVSQRYFDKPGVTYLAPACELCSSPDQPGSFDSVASIGATQLAKNGSNYSETLSGLDVGGCATGVTKPRWQSIIPNSICASRITNDAAAEGGCQPGVALFSQIEKGWVQICGTEVPTSFLAGVFGLAGNATQQKGGRTFWLKAHHKHLYHISGTCNYGYSIGSYTTCAGWGTPNGIGAF